MKNRLEKRAKRAKRTTQLRLLARSKIISSRVLQKVPIFAELSKEEISLLIDEMSYKKRVKGDIICQEEEVSDHFYVIVKGTAVVTKHLDNDDDENAEGHDVPVAELLEEQFFGESALLSEGSVIPIRTATVRVSSEKFELLCLHRSKFLHLFNNNSMFQKKRNAVIKTEGSAESSSVMERVQDIADDRRTSNLIKTEEFRKMQKAKSNLQEIEGDQGGQGGQGEVDVVKEGDDVGIKFFR